MAAKKKKASAEKGMTKTAFIQTFGPDVPADDIVAKGKAAGLTFTKKYVWTKQSEMRTGKASPKKTRAKGAKARKAPRPVSAAARRPTNGAAGSTARMPRARKATIPAGSGEPEQLLRSLILKLGTDRADAIYKSARSQLEAVVGAP